MKDNILYFGEDPIEGKKKTTLSIVFKNCLDKGNMNFTNKHVKDASNLTGFRNHNDATKLDTMDLLPKLLFEHDYFVVHVGRGEHKFVKGINNAYHKFEEITDKPQKIKFDRGILIDILSGESNILSIAYNNGILSDFLFQDKEVIPLIYNSQRTFNKFEYYIGDEKIVTKSQQIEIDLTLEHEGEITVFEAKNDFPTDFAVYQIYLSFLNYYQKNKSQDLGIKKINCCYLLRTVVDFNKVIRIYQYEFTDPLNMASINLVKSAEYILI